MRSFVAQLGINLFFIAVLMLLVAAIVNPGMFALVSLPMPGLDHIQAFKTMFISIVLEAVPFILLGVLISSILHVFVSDQWIARLVPKNPLLGILFGCLLGVLFPVCECGLIPVIRRLIAKGMPLYIGVVFIVVGPIVNPIVYAATYTAFRSRPEMVVARMGLALAVGVCIGLFIYLFVKKNQLRHSAATLYADAEGTNAPHQHTRNGNKLTAVMEHTGSEFISMGKYLMIGAIITAAIQAYLPRGSLTGIGADPLGSHFFMMGFAYILSLCSTADAFVASSFVSTFSAGSILTFLVFGPMLDFKSTLMLLAVFKSKFVLLLAILIAVLVFIGANLAEWLYFTN